MGAPEPTLEQRATTTPQELRPPAPAAAAAEPPGVRVAAAMGNRAFATVIGREGAGILPDGRAHPEVESLLARSRGSGGALDDGVRTRFAPRLGGDLDHVRVHTDDTAHALASSVSARAFATGSDVYFAPGEYRPGSPAGDRLLAHELAHVAQQRGAPASGPLTVSQPGDALERDADRTADDLLA